MKTTLNKIKSFEPCDEGWDLLLATLGKTEADDEELSIKFILESNGASDTVWALRAVDGHEKEIRLMTADLAETILHHFEEMFPEDKRPREAIDAARRYANGEIDKSTMGSFANAALCAANIAASNKCHEIIVYAARAAHYSAEVYSAFAAAWCAYHSIYPYTKYMIDKKIIFKYI